MLKFFEKKKPGKLSVTILELSLVMAFVISIILGAFLHDTQQDISDKLIRLHIVANSNSTADQNLKLLVRDRVLEEAQKIIGDETYIGNAYSKINANLDLINEAAQNEVLSCGSGYTVKTELTQSYFETRDYESFSLPAGGYNTLRVTIGQGEGKNWWCVVFPPLCLAAAEDFNEKALEANLTEDEIKLITEDGGSYKIKFKLVEIIESIVEKLK